jgi:hypothetical protein
MAVEITEYTLHLRREHVNEPSGFILRLNADTPCFLQKPAATSTFRENKSFVLMFEHGAMANMKIPSEFRLEVFPRVLPR